MTYKKLWRDVDNAGDKQAQVNALMAIWIVASQAFISGAQDLRAKADLFVGRLESWRDDLLGVFRGQPFIILEDKQRAKKFLWGAVAALLGETALGTAIAIRNGLPFWSGVFIASVLAIFFDAAFLFAWLRAKRYREALDKLRRFLLKPSLIIFGIALPVFFLGRMARGQMAVSLATVVSVSLWLATLSLLVLGATLLACAFIYNWTKRDKGDFDEAMGGQTALRVTMDKTLRELESRGVDTDPLLDQLRKDLKGHNLLGVGSYATPSGPAGLLNNAATKVKLLPVLLLALAFPHSSCTQENSVTSNSNAPVQEQSSELLRRKATPVDISTLVPPEDSKDTDVYIGIDGTMSTHPRANKMLANNFIKDAPRILIALGALNLHIYEVVENGRVPQDRGNFPLPKFTRPKTSKADAGDAGILPNIDEGVAENDKSQAEADFQSALTDHVGKMNQALSGLTEEKLMPSNMTEPKCSDINGFLGFLKDLSGERRRVAYLFTDGEESCSDGIKPIAIPNDLTLVVVLLPLRPQEAKESGDMHGLDNGFQERLERIRKTLPDAIVVPYNADLYKVVLDAEKKSKSQSKAVQPL